MAIPSLQKAVDNANVTTALNALYAKVESETDETLFRESNQLGLELMRVIMTEFPETPQFHAVSVAGELIDRQNKINKYATSAPVQ